MERTIEALKARVVKLGYEVREENPATLDEIAKLEAISGRHLSKASKTYLTTYGAVAILIDEADFNLWTESAAELIVSLQDDRKWARLNALSLVEYIRYSWSNDKDHLSPENLGQEAYDLLDGLICIGMMSDGYYEENGYIIERPDDQFSLYVWHQDDRLHNPEDDKPMPLEELLHRCIDYYEKNPEDFSMGALGDFLNT